jgi:DNA-binding MarR family transcriptional regulator
MSGPPQAPTGADVDAYRLDEQIGFILRRANQRHTAIFAREIAGDLTPTQFAALARLYELGTCSQNQLGRLVAVDAATIKGVVERLQARGLVRVAPDGSDRRRMIVSLAGEGEAHTRQAIAAAIRITRKTLKPLSAAEQEMLIRLLSRIV